MESICKYYIGHTTPKEVFNIISLEATVNLQPAFMNDAQDYVVIRLKINTHLSNMAWRIVFIFSSNLLQLKRLQFQKIFQSPFQMRGNYSIGHSGSIWKPYSRNNSPCGNLFQNYSVY